MNPKRIFGASLFLVLIFLNGCTPITGTSLPVVKTIKATSASAVPSSTPVTLLSTPELSYPYPIPGTFRPPPIPYPAPTSGNTPTRPPTSTVTLTPTATPTFTATTTFTATATFEPYTGSPFRVVFIRDGNLWLAEIGGKGERQLTHEPEGWRVTSYDFNPRGDRIAYTTQEMTPMLSDGLIKQLDLQSGDTYPFFGEGDLLIEGGIRWPTDTLLAYVYDDKHFAWKNPTPTRGPTPDLDFGMYPLFYFLYDITTGQTTLMQETITISPSPDRRYWVTCVAGYRYEPNCKFILHDLAANQTWPIAEETSWGWFLGWSFDSQWMLFSSVTNPYSSEPDYKILIVDRVTRVGKWVNLSGLPSWASTSNTVAYSSCERGVEKEGNCQIQFWSPDGAPMKQPIPLAKNFWIYSWTPDDTRLVLGGEDNTLWIINVDGSGLRPILGGITYPMVLSNPGEQ